MGEAQLRAPGGTEAVLTEEDTLRAGLYDLLAALLGATPDRDTLDRVAALSGDDSDLGRAVRDLAARAADADPRLVEREYNTLFIGLGRGELLPFASFYLTGFLNEKPLAVLRGHMAKLGIAADPAVKDPEDHIAALCQMMAGLIRGDFGARLAVADQEAFFNSHLAPWAGHFFSDLAAAKAAAFYAPVGRIGSAFMEIEIEAFRMTPAASPASRRTPTDRSKTTTTDKDRMDGTQG